KEVEILNNNLILFMKDKSNSDSIFDKINFMKVNIFLRNIDSKNVPGLTAKVFRTYIATKIVKNTLKNPPLKIDLNSTESKKIYIAKYAICKQLLLVTIRKELIQKTLQANLH